jgi:putative N6-adenine-specific DNA methylase
MRWPDFDATIWHELLADARRSERPEVVSVAGSDRDAGAIAAAGHNAARAGVGDDVVLAQAPISAAVPGPIPGWIISNPPYGVRVGDRAGLRALYARLGDVVRARFRDWTIALLSADRALVRATGLPLTSVLRTVNGGIPVEVVRTTERR